VMERDMQRKQLGQMTSNGVNTTREKRTGGIDAVSGSAKSGWRSNPQFVGHHMTLYHHGDHH
jgi:hypothetical protein